MDQCRLNSYLSVAIAEQYAQISVWLQSRSLVRDLDNDFLWHAYGDAPQS